MAATDQIKQVRTPFLSPRANAIAQRWVKSVRTEVSITCLSSTTPSCVKRCRRTSLILLIGVRIDRLASVRPATWQCLIFGLESQRQGHRGACIILGGLAPHRMTDHISAPFTSSDASPPRIGCDPTDRVLSAHPSAAIAGPGQNFAPHHRAFRRSVFRLVANGRPAVGDCASFS